MNFSRIFLLPVIALGCLAGCANLPHTAPLPPGVTVSKVANVDGDKAIALNPQGNLVAFTGDGLELLDTTAGSSRTIAPEAAVALSFAPDGRLAAAFREGARSSLRIFDAAGTELKRAQVPGAVTSLGWVGSTEAVATALDITKHSFGSNITGLLYRWNLAKDPVAATVHSTTIRRAVAALPETTLAKTAALSVSPYGDEVAFSMLKDPPLFTPYLETIIRHLDTGAQRQVSEAALESGGLVYSADGQKLLIGEGNGASRWVSVADGKVLETLPHSGRHLAASGSGKHLLLDGHLYEGNKEIATFPEESTGAFSHDGKKLAVAYKDGLYIVTGMQDAAPSPVAAGKRLLELRRLRSQGLITEDELRKEVGKLPAQ